MRLLTPILSTAFLRITNSPGVSIAGILSVPRAYPPAAKNLGTRPPVDNPRLSIFLKSPGESLTAGAFCSSAFAGSGVFVAVTIPDKGSYLGAAGAVTFPVKGS